VGGVHPPPLFAKRLTGVNTVDCWTSRFSLWAAKPLAPSLGATLGLEGQDFELRGDFDSVSAPGVAVLGMISLADYKGLGLPQLIPKNLVIIRVSTRDAEQPNPVSRSFALWDLHRCYQSHLQD